MSKALARLLFPVATAMLAAGCDANEEYTLKNLPTQEPSSEVAGLMNPFTLKYGAVMKLPREDPVRPESWRGPTDRFAAPLSEGAGLPMFEDFDITTIPPEGIVYASSARRAYPDVTSCVKAQQVLAQVVERKLPNLVKTEQGYENDDLGVYVSCTRKPGDRFIGLDLAIFHKESRSLINLPDELKTQFAD